MLITLSETTTLLISLYLKPPIVVTGLLLYIFGIINKSFSATSTEVSRDTVYALPDKVYVKHSLAGIYTA